METILIVDCRKERRERLVGVLCEDYSIIQKEHADEIDEGSKPVFAIIHENNWTARNGLRDFKGKLEAMDIPFLVFSAGAKDQVLHLERGDEYGVDVWREYLNSESRTLDIFYNPELEEFITKMAPLGLNNISHDLRERIIADVQCWYNKLGEKPEAKKRLKSFFMECNDCQAGHEEFPTSPDVLACLSRRYL